MLDLSRDTACIMMRLEVEKATSVTIPEWMKRLWNETDHTFEVFQEDLLQTLRVIPTEDTVDSSLESAIRYYMLENTAHPPEQQPPPTSHWNE